MFAAVLFAEIPALLAVAGGIVTISGVLALFPRAAGHHIVRYSRKTLCDLSQKRFYFPVIIAS